MSKQMSPSRWFLSRWQWFVVAIPALWKFHNGRKIKTIVCVIVLLLLAVAVFRTALPSRKHRSLDASSEELLLKLAKLGHAGGDLLCDTRSVEKHLTVQIKNSFAVKKSEGIFLIADASAKNSIFGTYSKLRVGEDTVCRLQLRFALHRFCNTDNAWTQRLLGRRVQPGIPMVGEAGSYDHGYEFGRKPLERSVIAWRHSTRSCSVDVEVASSQRR